MNDYDPTTIDGPHCAELPAYDVLILNAARAILKELAGATDLTRDGGIVHERAHDAEHAIFRAMSAYRIFGEQDFSDDLLHMRAPVAS